MINWRDDDENLLFASFDPVSRRVGYEPPLKIVINSPCKQKLVEFTARGEAHRWTATSDTLSLGDVTQPGSLCHQKTPQHKYADTKNRIIDGNAQIDLPAARSFYAADNNSSMCSVLATGNHNMYVSLGSIKTGRNGETSRTEPSGGNALGSFQKVRADGCINADLLRFKANAEAGRKISPESNVIKAIEEQLSELNLHTKTQKEAFFLLYGFWLGCGHLDFGEQGGSCAVVLEVDRKNQAWVEDVLGRCQVSHVVRSENGHLKLLSIIDTSWVELFFGEYSPTKYFDTSIRGSKARNEAHGETGSCTKNSCQSEFESDRRLFLQEAPTRLPVPHTVPTSAHATAIPEIHADAHYFEGGHVSETNSTCMGAPESQLLHKPTSMLAFMTDLTSAVEDRTRQGTTEPAFVAKPSSMDAEISAKLRCLPFESDEVPVKYVNGINRSGGVDLGSLEGYVNQKTFVRADARLKKTFDVQNSENHTSTTQDAGKEGASVESLDGFCRDLTWLDQIDESDCVGGDGAMSTDAERICRVTSTHSTLRLKSAYRLTDALGQAVRCTSCEVVEPAHDVALLKSKHLEGSGSCKLTKWLFWWALYLDKECSQAIIVGHRQVNSITTAGNQPAILTSSIRFRDELVQLMLHAGYSSHFLLDQAGCDRDTDFSDESSNTSAVTENRHRAWEVRFSPERRHEPTLHPATDVCEVQYSGYTWCAEMPSGFVIVRRAQREHGIVIRASVPTIQGNCESPSVNTRIEHTVF